MGIQRLALKRRGIERNLSPHFSHSGASRFGESWKPKSSKLDFGAIRKPEDDKRQHVSSPGFRPGLRPSGMRELVSAKRAVHNAFGPKTRMFYPFASPFRAAFAVRRVHREVAARWTGFVAMAPAL
jgi:hypothetical protein